MRLVLAVAVQMSIDFVLFDRLLADRTLDKTVFCEQVRLSFLKLEGVLPGT